jgi:uncharacterized protein
MSNTHSGVVVADAGPLIALARLHLLSVLSSLYKTVVVPSVVWQEVTGSGQFEETPALLQAHQSGWLKVESSESAAALDPSSALWMVDAGERAALELALARQSLGGESLLIVDDAAARACARRLKLSFVGTLGVLLRAKQRGLILEVVPQAQKLQSSGYFLSDALIEAVAERSGEAVPRPPTKT